MKISVVTVCLNAKDTIEETLLNIFNQTFEDIEVIVIDGVSKDGTLEVIEKYKDKITHFLSESDSGIYDAMNKGIKLATGDFICFLNAGDIFYDNNILEKVAQKLIKNPECKFLFGDAEYISKKGSKIVRYNNIKNEFSIIFDNICHQSIFYHKSLFEQLGLYSDKYKIYADWDFNINCLAKNKIKSIYLPLTICKFQLGGTCSNSENKKICKKEKELLIEEYYPEYKGLINTNDFIRSRFGFIYKTFFKKIIDKILAKDSSKNLNISVR